MRVSAEYLETLQYRIEIIANNISNVNTPGFKEGLLFIEETYDTRERSNVVAEYGGVMPATENPVINRNMYLGKRIDFRQGPLVETGNNLDLAVNGEGFFQIKTADGKIGYTRAGLFSTDSRGNIVNNEGMLMEPLIQIPSNASEISIKSDGTIKAILYNDSNQSSTTQQDQEVLIGQISLFKFNNPEGLEQIGHNMYLATEASGEAIEGTASTEGYGEIKSGMIERSNTDMVNAMTKLIEAQRAYQFDLRIAKDQDEMVQQAIAMRG